MGASHARGTVGVSWEFNEKTVAELAFTGIG